MILLLAGLAAASPDDVPVDSLLAYDPLLVVACPPGDLPDLPGTSTVVEPLVSNHPLALMALQGPRAGRAEGHVVLALGGFDDAGAAVDQAWLPADAPQALFESYVSLLESAGWQDAGSCGPGCVQLHERGWGSVRGVTLREAPGGVRMAARLPAGPVDLDRETPVRRTRALTGVLEGDAGWLLRFEHVPTYALVHGALERDLAAQHASPEMASTLWRLGTEALLESVAHLDLSRAEFEDLGVRRTEQGVQAIVDLTKLGTRVHPPSRRTRLPAWTGPEPLVLLSVTGDPLLGLSETTAHPTVRRPANSRDLARPTDCGLPCSMALLAQPGAVLVALMDKELPTRSGITGIRMGIALDQLSPFAGIALVTRNQSVAKRLEASLLESDLDALSMLDVRVQRSGRQVWVGLSRDAEGLFGELESTTAGVSVDIPAAAVLQNMPSPVPLAGLPERIHARVFKGAWIVDVGAPSPAPSQRERPLADIEDPDLRCLIDQGEPAYTELQAYLSERASACPGDGPLLLDAHATAVVWQAGVHMDALELGPARHAMDQACALGSAWGCSQARFLPPQSGPSAQLPQVEAAQQARGDLWIAVVGGQVVGPDFTCALDDRGCMEPALLDVDTGVGLHAAGDLPLAELDPLLATLRDVEVGAVLVAVQGPDGIGVIPVWLGWDAPADRTVTLRDGSFYVGDQGPLSRQPLTEQLQAWEELDWETDGATPALVDQGSTLAQLVQALATDRTVSLDYTPR